MDFGRLLLRSKNYQHILTVCSLATFLSINQNHVTFSTLYEEKEEEDVEKKNKQIKNSYDFVIIGYGRAGQSAYKTLQQTCPLASIAIIDKQKKLQSRNKKTKIYTDSIESISANNKTINLQHNKQAVTYKYGMLISTGSRTATLPKYSLIDPKVVHHDRVLDLFSSRNYSANEIYQISKMVAETSNKSITIMGSGIEALYLALSLASSCLTSTSSSSSEIHLIMGESSPLHSLLPSYLISFFLTRLRKIGIIVHERTVVRYISSNNNTMQNTESSKRMEIHTAKSFDTLQTERFYSDLVIVAPSTLKYSETNAALAAETTWNSVFSANTLGENSNNTTPTCFSNDARILVNPQLQVMSPFIYAAGSCAKFSRSEHYAIPGLTSYNSNYAGHVAALNMSRHYWNRSDFTSVQSMIGIWTTKDVLSKIFVSNTKDSDYDKVMKGIHATSIGECNSKNSNIHAFWWTNHAASIRRRSTISQNNSSSASLPSTMKPVYGIGILYYFDKWGTLTGVLLWGIPDVENGHVIQYIKNFIQSNAKGVLSVQDLSLKSQEILQLFLNSPQHYSSDITSASSASWQSIYTSTPSSKDKSLSVLKPLHRYTPAKNFLTTMNNINSPIFIPNSLQTQNQDIRLPSLKQCTLDEQAELTQKHNAKRRDYVEPQKEDSLWLYKGRQHKMSSFHDVQRQMFYSNIKSGTFIDGTDPLASRRSFGKDFSNFFGINQVKDDDS